ncbi:MAG: SUF system Fe-S cluster assembly regulator [Acetobacteraceae bacterium]|nr:SUF system Fe-S cluster assembly regulator [Acetobacteraceae bacterium]
MLRLSKLADYAVVVLARLSCGDCVQTSPGIAAATGLPEPTVAKVLKGLATSGLVTSQRGARGGYRLSRALNAILVSDVVAAIDGPVHLTACVQGSPSSCEAEHICSCRGGWDRVNEVVMQALGTISIADIAPIRALPDHLAPALPEPGIPAE